MQGWSSGTRPIRPTDALSAQTSSQSGISAHAIPSQGSAASVIAIDIDVGIACDANIGASVTAHTSRSGEASSISANNSHTESPPQRGALTEVHDGRVERRFM